MLSSFSSSTTDPSLSLWDLQTRERITGVKWRGTKNDENADVYSLTYSKKKEDFFVAGSINAGELQLFERNTIYEPTWTLSEIEGGVTCLDLSPRDDMLAFSTGNKRFHILNIGRVI
jgi:WD40 repeat protein